jgi:hypothetical protein
MEHLTQAELNDFARGLRRDPHPHLAECMDCANLLSFLRKVSESATSVDVPLEVVNEAKRIFPGSQDSAPTGSLKQVLARLVFLQTGGQQLAEVRSLQPAARQALYRFGDYCIDLRAEEQPDSIKTSLVGQIANQRDPLVPLSEVPVALLAGKRVLQQSTCNGLGEFVLDFVGNRRLRLKFDLPSDGLSIEVPLKDLSSEE